MTCLYRSCSFSLRISHSSARPKAIMETTMYSVSSYCMCRVALKCDIRCNMTNRAAILLSECFASMSLNYNVIRLREAKDKGIHGISGSRPVYVDMPAKRLRCFRYSMRVVKKHLSKVA